MQSYWNTLVDKQITDSSYDNKAPISVCVLLVAIFQIGHFSLLSFPTLDHYYCLMHRSVTFDSHFTIGITDSSDITPSLCLAAHTKQWTI